MLLGLDRDKQGSFLAPWCWPQALTTPIQLLVFGDHETPVCRQLREENRGLESELEEARVAEKEAKEAAATKEAELKKVKVRKQAPTPPT